MAVYTKTGDKGKTGTFSGKRISKSSKLIEAIGSIDELNSYLGVIGGFKRIQKNLFIINSMLSGAKLDLPFNAVKEMEHDIDEMEGSLPVLQNFLIYSGTLKARKIYFARALARRAERKLVTLNNKKFTGIKIYLNRLSDYLFMRARFENFNKKKREEIWS